MRRILSIVALAITAGCSSDEGTGPSPGESPVASIRIEGPETIMASDSVRLIVSLLDASAKPVSNRPITFASSDQRIAAVDGYGVVRGLAEGTVTITVSSGSARAKKSFRIVPRVWCSRLSPECMATAERYVLAFVNDRPLPVESPWGADEWDYDEDAGTWKVTHAELILFADGYYASVASHRAASGATSQFSFGGRYERRPGSVEFHPDGGLASIASVTEGSLVDRWADGRTLAYARQASLVALAVIASSPTNGKDNVPLTSSIAVRFNNQMNASTISATTFSVSSGGSPVAGSVTYDAGTHVAIFTPNGSLSPSQNYTATVTTAVKDVAGSALGADVSFSFATASSPAAPATNFLWVMVVDASGVCIPGATIRVILGQRMGESFTQKTPCDAWAYDGGVLFENVTVGAEMTLQATAPGYLTQEKMIVPTSGAQTAYLFTPSLDR
jgi:hypothetical protein